MSRLTEKTSKAEGSRGAGSIPDFPKFAPRLANAPGGQETNAAIQRWNDLMKRRWVLLDEDLTRRFTLEAGFNDSIVALTARIEIEESVRASADSALALSISTLESTVTLGFSTLTASVVTLQSAMATANGYLEARWTVQVTAGPIVTGMTLFSASGPDTDVSYIAFQADRFQVNTASGGNKQIFSATATAVKLGDVLTVDLSAKKVFIGVGSFANSNTAFYVDDSANFSLGDKLSWNGTTLSISGSITATTGTIGGWTIGATTISANNAVLNSAGLLVLGTANDVVYLSAADATYRLWVGNATAGSAAFSVTKAGALFSNSGTIGGFTISADFLSAGSGSTSIALGTGIAGSGFRSGSFVSPIGTGNTTMQHDGLRLGWLTGVGTSAVTAELLSITGTYGQLNLFSTTGEIRIGGSASIILFGGDTNIYRSAANTLKTDDALIVAGQITAQATLLINPTQKLQFEAIGNAAYIDESNGLQLHGDGTHPIKIVGGNLEVQQTLSLSNPLLISGTQVVTSRQSGVSDGPTDATGGMGTGDDFSGGDTVDKASLTSVVNTHGAKLNSFATKINAIGTAVNTVIDRLQTHGLIS